MCCINFRPVPHLILILLLSLSAHDATGEEVYKWVDSSGKEYFSSTSPTSDAIRVPLPAIGRENIDDRIESIKSTTPPNCNKHGGIDCDQGSDADGSVICSDGYTDALLPFRFGCLEARLVYGNKSLVGAESDEPIEISNESSPLMPAELATKRLQVTVRNRTGVEAIGVKLSFRLQGYKPIEAFGPDKVEPFGVAYYILPLRLVNEGLNWKRVVEATTYLSCTNCGATSKVH